MITGIWVFTVFLVFLYVFYYAYIAWCLNFYLKNKRKDIYEKLPKYKSIGPFFKTEETAIFWSTGMGMGDAGLGGPYDLLKTLQKVETLGTGDEIVLKLVYRVQITKKFGHFLLWLLGITGIVYLVSLIVKFKY